MTSCSRCFAELASGVMRCAVCGAPRELSPPEVWTGGPSTEQAASAASPTPLVVPKPASKLAGLADNPWVVLATIFFVTAAFGIPLIWMCKAWSYNTKLMLTVVTILYTIVILWLFMLVMTWCYNNIVQAL